MEIRYLSWLRNRIGTAQEEIALPGQVRTLQDLAEWMSGRGDAYKTLFSHRSIINASVNGALVQDWAGSPVSDGDKICFFSPLAGG